MNAFSGFEGSYLGAAGKIADDTRLECKICWYVYDPAKGCPDWQVPAGTPFTRLPVGWRCPNCDADPTGFMVLDATSPAATVAAVQPPAGAPLPSAEPAARRVGEALEAAFRELHRGKMRDVPFLNKSLQVQAIGFRPYATEALGANTLGVLLTPWFMNLVLVPDEKPDPVPQTGTKSFVDFPSGRYEFIWADRPEIGPYRACSLFSPVQEFTSQLVAIDIGQAVLKSLFDETIREHGARTGEIRTLREADVKRAEEKVAALTEAVAVERTGEPPPSRRAVLTLGAARETRTE